MKKILSVLLCLLLLPSFSAAQAEESSPYGYVAKLAAPQFLTDTPAAPQFITVADKETAEQYLEAGMIEYYEVNSPVFLPEDVPAAATLQSTAASDTLWQYTAVNYPDPAPSLGRGVVIGILDSGVNPHDAFGNRLLPGYNILNDNTDTEDSICHGTRVAGMAAGMAPEAFILPIKAFDAGKSTYVKDILDAIETGIEAGCDILNLSLGFNAFSSTEQGQAFIDMLAYAETMNILTVAAVGNAGTDAIMYPSALPGVIGVGAVVQSGSSYTKASYSQYNAWVDVVAPGSCIGFPDKDSTSDYVTASDTAHINGTSFACPMISGILAQGLAYNRALPARLVGEALQASARDLGDAGPDDLYGYGLADVTAFFAMLDTASGQTRMWQNTVYSISDGISTEGVSLYNAGETTLHLYIATYTEDFRELTEISAVSAQPGYSFVPVASQTARRLFLFDGLQPALSPIRFE